MAKRHFILTPDQTTELRQAYGRAKDGATRTRYQAVWLYGTGYPTGQVQQSTGCSRASLMDWCRHSRTHGVASLGDGRVGGNRAKLPPPQRHMVRTTVHHYTRRQLFGPDTATADGQFWTVPDRARQSQTLNAQATVAHREQILMAYPDVPIRLLWDRAPGIVDQPSAQCWRAHPRLDSMPLPVAAPDLNPQEQVWKATRQAVSHNHAVPSLCCLAAQFETHLTQTRFVTSFLEHRGFYAICSRSNC